MSGIRYPVSGIRYPVRCMWNYMVLCVVGRVSVVLVQCTMLLGGPQQALPSTPENYFEKFPTCNDLRSRCASTILHSTQCP